MASAFYGRSKSPSPRNRIESLSICLMSIILLPTSFPWELVNTLMKRGRFIGVKKSFRYYSFAIVSFRRYQGFPTTYSGCSMSTQTRSQNHNTAPVTEVASTLHMNHKYDGKIRVLIMLIRPYSSFFLLSYIQRRETQYLDRPPDSLLTCRPGISHHLISSHSHLHPSLS